MTTNTIERVRKTEKHTGKMSGMQSLSTSCTVNPHCIERMKNGNSICAHCYASRMMKRYGSLERKLITNTKILATRALTLEEIEALNINCKYFRLESFGDVVNVRHARNYLSIAFEIPDTNFAQWTKNIGIVDAAIAECGGKPENLKLIYSMEKINPTEDEITAALAKSNNIDAVFAVYTKEYAEAHNIDINCGAKHCLSCLLCYKKNDIRIIREILK